MNFLEVTTIVGILLLVGLMLLIMRNNEKTGEKLEKSYPAETKELLGSLIMGVVYMATQTANPVDDKGALLLVTLMKSMGVEIPPEALALFDKKPSPDVGNSPVVPVKAPDIG
jgi:hypothetical protein